MPKIRSPQNLGAAIVFSVVGLFGLHFGSDLPGMRPNGQLGSGTFPLTLSLICLGFGGIMGARALVADGPVPPPVRVRPLAAIVLSVVLFGALIESAGYLPTAIATPLIAALALTDFRWKEALLVSTLLGAAASILFVVLLRQPMNIWWG